MAEASLAPWLTVVGLGDFVRHHLDVFLYDFFVELTTDQTLYCVQGVMRVGYSLALGRLTDEDFTVVGVSNDRRRSTRAFGVFDDFCNAVFQHGDAGVGGPQVDTDNFAHDLLSRNLNLDAAAVVANCGST